MPDNNSNNSKRQIDGNAVSNQSSDNVEDAVLRLKIHDNQERGVTAQSSPYPGRPGERDCVYYLRTGSCAYGSNCRYNHPPYSAQGTQFTEDLPERDGQPDCVYYLKTGTCKYGSTCKFHHPKDRNGAGPVTFNILGLPMRQDEKSCPYYLRTGSCKFGVACKFHHPQPSAVGTGLPLAGHSPFGSTEPPVVPPSVLPYVGLPTWSLPEAPYMSGPRVQGPQAYMPVVLSLSQGVVPAQGWNTYVGNLSPLYSGGLASHLVYNSRNQGESGSNGQVHLSSTPSSNFPERPDEPECRHFMSTGTCKYGSECKYHHPKERVAQASTNIGAFGLPSRPGQAVCSNYIMYGICKFGPSCRFDHPFPGYSYSYSLSLPPSTLDSSLLNYSRMSLTDLTSGIPPQSKVPDWVQNPDSASNKHPVSNINRKNSDDPLEQNGSPPPHSSQSSSQPSP